MYRVCLVVIARDEAATIGRLLDSVDDPAFSARFFAIWLSPQTSQPRMREALIAGAAR